MRSHRKDPHQFPFGNQAKVEEVRKWLEGTISEGAICPCCGQIARVYVRTLSSAISVALILICRTALAQADEWVHVPTLLSNWPELMRGGGEYGKAVHWDLLEARMDAEGEGKGWYRPTEKGIAFVEEAIMLPEYVHIYDGRRIEFSGRNIGVRDSLGTKYRYEDLRG
jgi:hypothetical protein